MFAKSKNNTCEVCRKVFCCADCMVRHKESKHPESKCTICSHKSLPFGASKLREKDLIAHLSLHHLPLRCRLCGELFCNFSDLTSANLCSWWTDRNCCTIANNLAGKSHFGKLDDSAELLVRHTSTPVHGIAIPAISNQSYPSFLKTPGQKSIDSQTLETMNEIEEAVHDSSESDIFFEAQEAFSDAESNAVTKNNEENAEKEENEEKEEKEEKEDTRILMMLLVETGKHLNPINMELKIEKKINSGEENYAVIENTRKTTSLRSSCLAVSETVERIETDGKSSDSIFSVLASVFKCAIEKFPGSGTFNLTTQTTQTIQTTRSPKPLREKNQEETSGSSKRPRAESVAGSPTKASFSPAIKRQKGWYRIKARKPIARMRHLQQLTSPIRGSSLETQRFHRGSLSVGDVILPLPSRAQSTQTDDFLS